MRPGPVLLAAAILGSLDGCADAPDPPDVPQGATMFAPAVISTDTTDDLHATFTPDGDTVYFVRRVADGRFTIMYSNAEDGGWTAPRVAPFSGRYADQEPSFSADGRRLYFTSDRPLAGTKPVTGRETWVVEREGAGWREPRRLEAPIRIPRSPAPTAREPGRFWGQARGPVEGPDGALYFWAERPGSLGHTDLYRAPAAPEPGVFEEPRNLGPPISSEYFETGAAFSPDGLVMVFGRDEDPAGFGLGDLFISHRTPDGWSEPENLGASVNSAQFDFAPRFSPDGRRLYFSSNRSAEGEGRGSQNIYYVDWPVSPR